jgi:outer membrane protein assembly factor BamD (BamD/ComL family)
MIKKYLLTLFLPFLFVFPLCADDLIVQAEKMAASGSVKEAIQLFNKIKQTYPDSDWSMKACLSLASLYEKQGKTENAVNEYKKVISDYSKKPQAEEAFFHIARLKAMQRDSEGAAAAYRSYLERYPQGAYKVMALFNIASLMRDANQEEKALKYYTEILNNYAGQTWFYSWAAIYSGHINFGMKQYDRAIGFYERVIKRDDNKSLYTLSNLYIGLALMQKKDYEAAKGVFATLLKSSNYYSEEAMIGLGSAYYKAKEYDLSKEVFDTFLVTYPKSVWEDYVKKRLKRVEAKISNPSDTSKDD